MTRVVEEPNHLTAIVLSTTARMSTVSNLGAKLDYTPL